MSKLDSVRMRCQCERQSTVEKEGNKRLQIVAWRLCDGKSSEMCCTSTAESRDASARMSAHETVWGQASSRAALTRSITSKPLAEFLFARTSFSETKSVVLSNRIDPSHPYRHSHGRYVKLSINLAMAFR